MWVLIVWQLMAGGPGNSQTAFTTGVVMQEFSTKRTCEAAMERVEAVNRELIKGVPYSGILKTECVPK